MKIFYAIMERASELLKERGITEYRLEKVTAIPYNIIQSSFCNNTINIKTAMIILKALKMLSTEFVNDINLKTVMLMIKGLKVTASKFFDDPRFDYDNLDI